MTFIKGKPEKSGHYTVRFNGDIGKDDYTTSGGGHWWNTGGVDDQEDVEYDPESYKPLGSY